MHLCLRDPLEGVLHQGDPPRWARWHLDPVQTEKSHSWFVSSCNLNNQYHRYRKSYDNFSTLQWGPRLVRNGKTPENNCSFWHVTDYSLDHSNLMWALVRCTGCGVSTIAMVETYWLQFDATTSRKRCVCTWNRTLAWGGFWRNWPLTLLHLFLSPFCPLCLSLPTPCGFWQTLRVCLHACGPDQSQLCNSLCRITTIPVKSS